MDKHYWIGILCFIFVLFISVANQAFEQQWYTCRSAKITWDAVTEIGGVAMPETYNVEYGIYITDIVVDPYKQNYKQIGTTSSTAYTISFDEIAPIILKESGNSKGRFLVGLKTIVKLQDGTLRTPNGESYIGWTDDIKIVADGETFGFVYPMKPDPVKNFRILGMLQSQ